MQFLFFKTKNIKKWQLINFNTFSWDTFKQFYMYLWRWTNIFQNVTTNGSM